MKRLAIGLVVAGAAMGGAAAARAAAGPLFWQMTEESDGVTVRRLHDAEAGVNCYVASAKGEISGSSGGYTYRINGNSKSVSISCVKVR